MHSFSKSRKAQFFVLSAVTIVLIIFFMSRWMEPYTIIDTSSAVMEEPFVFTNIKEKAITAVSGSRSCEDLRYNIEEYKNFVENYALSKNYKLDFNITVSPCYDEPPLFPVVVEVKMMLRSPDKDFRSNYTMSWMPTY